METLHLNLKRKDQPDNILLPAPGETVPAGDPASVSLVGLCTEPVAGEIIGAEVNPPDLRKYLDVGRLVGQRIEPNTHFEANCITLTNPASEADAPPRKRDGQLLLTLRFNRVEPEGGLTHPIPFSLVPFPVWQGTFALDFGNTSSTCVVLPPDVFRLFEDDRFRCLNWDDPNTEGDSQPTAVEFVEFVDRVPARVRVGADAVKDFEDMVQQRTVGAISKFNAYRIGGIKRVLAVREPTERTFESREFGQEGPMMSGLELNTHTLKGFVRRSEDCQRPHDLATPVGRFRKVVATHPVNFNPIQLDAIREAYAAVGITNVDLRYDEATAAAIYYLAKQLHGSDRIHEFWTRTENPADPPPAPGAPEVHTFNMLVFDCGGGTTDIALMRVEIERRTHTNPQGAVSQNWFEVRPTVYGLTGMKDFAGDNMTLEAMKLIRFRVAEKLATLGEPVQADENTWSGGDKENFDAALEKFAQLLRDRPADQTPAEFARFVDETNELCKRIVPTDFKSKYAAPSSRDYQLRLDLFHQLWHEAERLKKGLCLTDPKTSRPFAEYPAMVPDRVRASYKTIAGKSMAQEPRLQSVVVARAELDARIARRVGDAWELAADLCTDLAPGEKVHQVILAGNGCRYPLVREMLRTVFADSAEGRFEYQEGHIKFDAKDAKLACAKGAAIAEWFRLNQPEDINVPDQTLVVFKPGAVNRLPYPILLQALTTHDTLFERGHEVPPGPGAEKTLNYQAQFVVKQGLQKRNKDVNVPFCLFACEGPGVEPPAGMGEKDKAGVVFRVNELHELSAALVWRRDGKTAETPLRREELPPASDAKFNNPFEGWN